MLPVLPLCYDLSFRVVLVFFVSDERGKLTTVKNDEAVSGF